MLYLNVTGRLIANQGTTQPALITVRWVQHFDQLLNRQSSISDAAIDEIPSAQ